MHVPSSVKVMMNYWNLTVREILIDKLMVTHAKSVVPPQSASRSFTPASRPVELTLQQIEIGIYLTQRSVTHHKPELAAEGEATHMCYDDLQSERFSGVADRG